MGPIREDITVAMAIESPERDYLYLEENPDNPVSESALHFRWARLIASAVEDVRSSNNDLVTGNVFLNPADDTPRTAPDIMVIPGLRGREFRSYRPGPGEPLPSAGIEIRSRSNSKAEIERRAKLLLGLGVGVFLVLDPERNTLDQAHLDPQAGLSFSDARAVFFEPLGLTFVLTASGLLALCCPGDRVVTIDDNPYSLLREETRRADTAEGGGSKPTNAPLKPTSTRLRPRLGLSPWPRHSTRSVPSDQPS